MDYPKYANFDISEVTYKVISGKNIQASFLSQRNSNYLEN